MTVSRRRTWLFGAIMWSIVLLSCGARLPTGDMVFDHADSNTSYPVFTDRLGQTPPRVDVMALGCSFTWGFGVRNEETYTEQLKQLLGITAVNLGMGGDSSIQCLQRLRRNLELQPKVVSLPSGKSWPGRCRPWADRTAHPRSGDPPRAQWLQTTTGGEPACAADAGGVGPAHRSC